MDSFEEYEKEFLAIMNEVNGGIQNINKNRKNYDRGQVEMLRARLKRARDVIKSYRVEIRTVGKDEKAQYQARAEDFEQQANKTENDLVWAEKQAENGVQGSTPQGEANIQQEYNKIMNKGLELQKKDINLVGDVLREVEQINVEGTQIVEQMAVQEEQLKRIDKGLNEVDSNLKLAGRQMRVFARKMATDKIILGLILLVVIAIVIVIIFSIVKPKSNPQVRDRIVGSNS